MDDKEPDPAGAGLTLLALPMASEARAQADTTILQPGDDVQVTVVWEQETVFVGRLMEVNYPFWLNILIDSTKGPQPPGFGYCGREALNALHIEKLTAEGAFSVPPEAIQEMGTLCISGHRAFDRRSD